MVLLVVRANMAQKSAVEEAFNMLTSAQAKPADCIFTGFKVPAYYYYTNYRYYYGYSYQAPKRG